MTELNIFQRFWHWIYETFTPKKKREAQSEASKREMCHRCVESGVCPKTCEICAWDTFHKRVEER